LQANFFQTLPIYKPNYMFCFTKFHNWQSNVTPFQAKLEKKSTTFFKLEGKIYPVQTKMVKI